MIEQIQTQVNEVLEGNIDALQTYGELKELETVLKLALEQVYEVAISEAEKEDKTFQHAGFRFERRNGATRYSFKHIPQWNDLTNQVRDFEATCKAALKVQGKIQTATNDGEEVPLPIVTVSKDSLIVKRAK
jgi:hypothetical protein